MYELGPPFPDVTIRPGTNLLVAGPPMTGKRSLALDVLAHGSERGDGTLIVSTTDDAPRILDDLRARTGDSPADVAPVGVVDCVSRQQGVRPQHENHLIRYASSPNDLTGIGIQFSELLQTFYQEYGIKRSRVLLFSLSTLLMYADLQTVFRFLHVFTGRVTGADAIGLFVMDSTAHDDQTRSTIQQLFDGVIEVDPDGDGGRARVVGLPDVATEWHAY